MPAATGPDRPGRPGSRLSTTTAVSSLAHGSAAADKESEELAKHKTGSGDVSKLRGASAPYNPVGGQTAAGSTLPSIREAYLTERVAALETQLAQATGGKGALSSQQASDA